MSHIREWRAWEGRERLGNRFGRNCVESLASHHFTLYLTYYRTLTTYRTLTPHFFRMSVIVFAFSFSKSIICLHCITLTVSYQTLFNLPLFVIIRKNYFIKGNGKKWKWKKRIPIEKSKLEVKCQLYKKF